MIVSRYLVKITMVNGSGSLLSSPGNVLFVINMGFSYSSNAVLSQS